MTAGNGKKSMGIGMSVANFTLLTYASLMISLFQALLYVSSNFHSKQTYATRSEFESLSHLLQSMQMPLTQESLASHNFSLDLANQIESLRSDVLDLKQELSLSQQQLDEKPVAIERLLDEKVTPNSADAGKRASHSTIELDRNLQEDQEQILQAIDVIYKRLRILEHSKFAHEISLSEQRQHFLDMTKNIQAIHTSIENRLATLAITPNRTDKKQAAHLSCKPVQFWPLKDGNTTWLHEDSRRHKFMSQIIGRGRQRGPPELFFMPSNLTGGRLLCLKGNHTGNGMFNSYAFAFRENLPPESVLLPGTTLISETSWDYRNPWHAMYNLVQFVYWKMTLQCESAQRLIVYHWAELRTELGYWIKNVFEAASLPTEADSLNYGERPVCLENDVVSRLGIGGVPGEMMGPIFAEVRCTSRRKCRLSSPSVSPYQFQSRFDDGGDGGFEKLTDNEEGSSDNIVKVTLMARTGPRAFRNLKQWEAVIDSQCSADVGCSWSTVLLSNLTFCQQVEVMSKTDILITVHGAQMTNMVFMSPGSRVMEMFPRGWAEFAGRGQYIYSHLANWVGLQHEGYWRDSDAPKCPNPSKQHECFSFHKDQAVGINVTHISQWLAKVIADFAHVKVTQILSVPPTQRRANPNSSSVLKSSRYDWDNPTCTCVPTGAVAA